MSSQTKLITDILSIFETILENKNVTEATDIYSNVDFKNIGLGNPISDDINTALLQDIQTAARAAGVKVDITTAVSGHKHLPSRHPSGNAVDIAMINGKAVSPSNRADADKLVSALVSMGYTKNSESGNPKAVLTFGFPGHDDHVHVSNETKQSSSEPTSDNKDTNTSSDNTSSDSTSYDSSYGDLTPDPLVMGWANTLTKVLGLKEEKIYGKFGNDTQIRRGTIVIPKDNNSQIKSPISGIIILGRNNSSCKNKVSIKHNINGDEYYLEYCGIDNISARDNRKISKGDVIGTTDSDVRVSLYDSSNSKEYIDNFVGKESDEMGQRNPKLSNDNETVISKLLQLPFKPFKNKYDESGKMIEKRWGSSTEKKQPEPWINKLSPTYNPEKQGKKLEENINRIKGLLK